MEESPPLDISIANIVVGHPLCLVHTGMHWKGGACTPTTPLQGTQPAPS